MDPDDDSLQMEVDEIMDKQHRDEEDEDKDDTDKEEYLNDEFVDRK